MRAVIQRVERARASVGGVPVGACGYGFVVLVGVARGDGPTEADTLARKVARLRIFENDRGKFDRSLLETGGEALVVSQFTLISGGPGQKGARPDFSGAASSAQAEPLYERFCESLRGLGVPVATGRFGARMQVELVNDGPVTIVLEVEPEADTAGS